jgi:hypothetical protein
MYTRNDIRHGTFGVASHELREDRRSNPYTTARAAAFDTRWSAYAIELLMLLSAVSILMLIDLGRTWL